MVKARQFCLSLAFLSLFLSSHQVFAQGSTEEKFHELFVTAGYSTAFGAALGMASLAFTNEPASKLSYIAIGASLGFIGGSLLGTYLVLTPMLVAEDSPHRFNFTADQNSPHRVNISPLIASDSHKVVGLASNVVLLRF